MLKVYQNIKKLFTLFIGILLIVISENSSAFTKEQGSYVAFSLNLLSFSSIKNPKIEVEQDESFNVFTTDMGIETNILRGAKASFGSYLTHNVSLEAQFSLFNKLKISNGQFINSQTGEALENLEGGGLMVQSFSVLAFYDFYKKENLILQGGLGVGMLYFEDDIEEYKWLFEDDQIYYTASLRAIYPIANTNFSLTAFYQFDYSSKLHDLHKINQINFKEQTYIGGYTNQSFNFGFLYSF